MSTQRHIITEAVILKTSIINETNKLLVFISPELGIQRAIAYGAASIKNRFCSSVSPCIKAKLFLYKNQKTEFYKLEDIADVLINNSFTKELKNIYLFSFMSEVLQSVFVSNEEYKNYYFLLCYSLELLNENKHQSAFLFFTTKFLFLSGYNYNLSKCLSCGNEADIYYFDEKSGGIFCALHSQKNLFKLSSMAAKIWKKFFENKYTDLKNFKFDKCFFNEIFNITIYLMKNIFEKNIKTIPFLGEIF